MMADQHMDVLTMGEALIRLVPSGHGPLEHAVSLSPGVGGAEVNAAIGLSRLGYAVTWVGCVGDDPWGRLVLRTLHAEQVRTVSRIAEGHTGVYVRETRAGQHRRAYYLRKGSAGSRLSPDDVTYSLVAEHRLLHVTGITAAISESAQEAVRQAMSYARDAGVTVSLDINHRRALWTDARAAEVLTSLLPNIDVVLAGEDEAAVLLGVSNDDVVKDPEMAISELASRIRPEGRAVLKQGSVGSMECGRSDDITRGTAVAVPVVDPVGAGDAFASGWLAAWLDGRPPPQRLEWGHAVAAYVVATDGDWEGLPRLAELREGAALHDTEVHR
jgi:2-dehydro-3-deoxygluconokinase